MGSFDFFRTPDINQGIAEYSSTSGAILLDVRSPQEFRSGHIPGSNNIPLRSIDNVEAVVDNKDTPIFVYCQSGVRSRQAASELQEMGFTRVKNLGGISAYTGKVAY